MCWTALNRLYSFLSTLSLRRATWNLCPCRIRLLFLSTLSLRRATNRRPIFFCRAKLFYPRSPCGERRFNPLKTPIILHFSIHALLAESDRRSRKQHHPQTSFLSTLSLRRATPKRPKHQTQSQIFYPRSPCGERPPNSKKINSASLFYPRSPCGERPYRAPPYNLMIRLFYPRSPCGERPELIFFAVWHIIFSIHALLAESDGFSYFYIIKITVFYPRSPCGERRDEVDNGADNVMFSIHALLAESDRTPQTRPQRLQSFLSTLSLRRATRLTFNSNTIVIFLSTLSLRRATAKVHKTVGHFCAYGTNFMGIASSC